MIEETLVSLTSKDLTKIKPEDLKKVFGNTSGRVLASNPHIIDFLETMKFKIGFLNFYLEVNSSQLTFMKKLEYFEEY